MFTYIRLEVRYSIHGSRETIFELVADIPNYGRRLPNSSACGGTVDVAPYPPRAAPSAYSTIPVTSRITLNLSPPDGGATFSTPIAVVDKASRKAGLVSSGMSMAMGKGDRVYVAMITNNWQTKLPGVPDGLIYSTLVPAAGVFTAVRSLNGRPSEGFSLAADSNGNVAASWLSGKLFANFSRDGGKTFPRNTEVNKTYLPCECCTSSAVYGVDGDLAVLYRERTNNERDVYVVLVNKDGHESRTRISDTPWRIDACPMTYYMISAAKEGYVAAWPTKGDIYFARLNRNGKVLLQAKSKPPDASACARVWWP